MKAKVAVIGAAVLASTAGFGALQHAQAAQVAVPAPKGVGSAVAVQVGDLLGLGKTDANSGAKGPSASAQPISLGNSPLLAGVKDATKSASGALLDTKETPIGRVAVAPWSTDVKGNQAQSTAAVATAKLNGIGSVAVAPSSALALWSPAKSSSKAVSDGAVIKLGDFTLKILHAESSDSGRGLTYLVEIMGKQIGTTNAKGCMLDVGPLATVGCLQALNGVTGSADANVAQALLGDKSPVGKVVAATTQGGIGTAAATPTAVLGKDVSRSATSSGVLARTGMNLLMIFAFGLLLAVAGAVAISQSRAFATLPLRAKSH